MKIFFCGLLLGVALAAWYFEGSSKIESDKASIAEKHGHTEMISAESAKKQKEKLEEGPGALKLSETDNLKYLDQAHCFDSAATRYSIPVGIILAIAEEESGFDNGKTSRLDDNTTSFGVMQINSRWFTELEAKFAIDQKKIINDDCTNVFVGAWILANYFREKGRVWNNIGAYRYGFKKESEPLREAYVVRIMASYDFYKKYLKIHELNTESAIAEVIRSFERERDKPSRSEVEK